jgi:predicted PurR-regulated permease PerM
LPEKTEVERITHLIFYIAVMAGGVLLLGWLAWQIVRPLIAEIGWAIVFAICLEPLRTRLAKLGRTQTAALLTLGLVLLVVLPAVFLVTVIAAEAKPVVAYLESRIQAGNPTGGWLHTFWEWARTQAPFLPAEDVVTQKIAESASAVARFLSLQAASILTSAVSFVFSLLLTVVFVFFFLRDADSHASLLRRALPFGREQNERLLDVGRELILASVTATLLIAVIQGFVGGVAFWLLGIEGPVMWGAVMAVFALVPLVGTALVWVPAAIWLALSGSIVKALILVAIGVLGIGMVDNLVRPIFLSGKAQMNTLVLIVSLIGGVSAFGFIGIVLGPLVAAIFTALVDSYYMTRDV